MDAGDGLLERPLLAVFVWGVLSETLSTALGGLSSCLTPFSAGTFDFSSATSAGSTFGESAAPFTEGDLDLSSCMGNCFNESSRIGDISPSKPASLTVVPSVPVEWVFVE